jgi:P27 family predicted phage terminase small subunit
MQGGLKDYLRRIGKREKMKQAEVNPITPTKGRPAAPRHLAGEALAEWERVCDELEQMGTLATSDRSVIALYVTAWARWVKAEEKISASGEIVAAPKTKTPMANPWTTVSNKAHEQATKLLAELGLTPRSRALIAKNAAAAVGNTETVDDEITY